MRLLPPANIPSHAAVVSFAMQNSLQSATRGVEKAEQLLLGLCEQLNFPVTWGVVDPASASAEAIRTNNALHEIGVLIDPDIESRREMLRRLDAVTPDGTGVSTVLCHAPVREELAELLARHGVSIVACDRHGESHVRSPSPVTTIRFGLWEVTASASISKATAGAERRIRRHIDHAAAAGGLLHLAVDAEAIGQSVAAAAALERLLGHISQRHERGTLRVLTAAQLAAQFRRRPRTPAKSILRISTSLRDAA